MGAAHIDDQLRTFPFVTEACADARIELGRHFEKRDHQNDGARQDGDNIYSVGVEMLMVREMTATEKLHAISR